MAHRIVRIAAGEDVPDLAKPVRKNPAAVRATSRVTGR